MKITKIQCHLMQAQAPAKTGWSATGKSVLSSTRNWLFVKIHTDAGLIGLGEGSGWPRVVATAIDDLAHLLIGENASDTERISQKIRVALMAHGQTGVVGMGALAAIDTALWDLKGQQLGVPICQLLGGMTRSQVPYYVHAPDAATAVAAVAAGAKGIKVGGISNIVQRAHEVREAIGKEIDMMVDLHGPPWLTGADAVAIGRALEPLGLLFLEEPVAPDDMRGWQLVRDKVALPLACGERLATLQDMLPFIEKKLVDVLQPDTGRFGGITQMKKLAAIAEAQSMTIAPHSGSLGPVAEFAAVHLMACIPNALMLERLEPDWSGKEAVLTQPLQSAQGFITVPLIPGLGTQIHESFVAAHPSICNTGIATGGANAGTEHETVYFQQRRQRARITEIAPK